MNNEQLYLAIGVPILFNGLMLLVLNARITDLGSGFIQQAREGYTEVESAMRTLDPVEALRAILNWTRETDCGPDRILAIRAIATKALAKVDAGARPKVSTPEHP